MNDMYVLIAVKDIEKSKKFYCELLGLEILEDLGVHAVLTGGLALQTEETWLAFIEKDKSVISYGGNNGQLSFEVDDHDKFMEKLSNFDVKYVHELKEHSWGQRTIRFYDLDDNIIEVGENMVIVTKRFIDSGLSIEETATRMDVPVSYVLNLINK